MLQSYGFDPWHLVSLSEGGLCSRSSGGWLWCFVGVAVVVDRVVVSMVVFGGYERF